MNSYNQKLSLSEERAFGLDSSSVKMRNFNGAPCPEKIGLTRVK
jgi:KUP system potassium uptake protein